jgi:hypothetical protein
VVVESTLLMISYFYVEHGIIFERTLPFLTQLNRMDERNNHTITNLVNNILDTSDLSKGMVGAILTTCYILNQVPMKNKYITPFEEKENKMLKLSY